MLPGNNLRDNSYMTWMTPEEDVYIDLCRKLRDMESKGDPMIGPLSKALKVYNEIYPTVHEDTLRKLTGNTDDM